MRSCVYCVMLFAGLLLHCNMGPDSEYVAVQKQAVAPSWGPCLKVTLPSKSKPPALPGADPNKTVGPDLCPSASMSAAPTPEQQALIAKQQAYLAAWQMQKAGWQSLSAAEQEQKRAVLKQAMLKGGNLP